MFDHQKYLQTIPHHPGCYLMRDHNNVIIYIGKAKNLQKRVRSYFTKGGDNRRFIPILGEILKDIEVIVTITEAEAIQLEITLIRTHKPKYNVVYKDDRRELIIRLDEAEQFPMLELVRRRDDDSAFYLGPFFAAKSARSLVRFLNQAFQLRVCNNHTLKNTKRPCLEYEIKHCSAPCTGEISESDYRNNIEQLKQFLTGKGHDLIDQLKKEMLDASEALLFEKAARFRDQIKAFDRFLGNRLRLAGYDRDADLIHYAFGGDLLVVMIMILRNGLIIDSREILLKGQHLFQEEAVISVIEQYYKQRIQLPKEIVIPDLEWDYEGFLTYLKGCGHGSVSILTPQRGRLVRLLEICGNNARLRVEKEGFLGDQNRAALESIQKRFHLNNFPKRIECYDNASGQGKYPASSRVTFTDGMPDKRRYRRYKIKTITESDDYGMMREVLVRRVKRGVQESDLPDLIVVDGGKGQLKVAYAVLKFFNLEDKIDLLALAKVRSSDTAATNYNERIFKWGDPDPVVLKQNSPEMVIFVKLRDEAHRFVNSFHQKLREDGAMGGFFKELDGVGPKRKKALMFHFKTVENLKKATIKKLAEVDGISYKLAQKLRKQLKML